MWLRGLIRLSQAKWYNCLSLAWHLFNPYILSSTQTECCSGCVCCLGHTDACCAESYPCLTLQIQISDKVICTSHSAQRKITKRCRRNGDGPSQVQGLLLHRTKRVWWWQTDHGYEEDPKLFQSLKQLSVFYCCVKQKIYRLLLCWLEREETVRAIQTVCSPKTCTHLMTLLKGWQNNGEIKVNRKDWCVVGLPGPQTMRLVW